MTHPFEGMIHIVGITTVVTAIAVYILTYDKRNKE